MTPDRQQMGTLLEKTLRLLELPAGNAAYQVMADDMRELTGARYLMFNTFEESGRTVIRSVAGNPADVQAVGSAVGRSLIGMNWMPLAENTDRLRCKGLCSIALSDYTIHTKHQQRFFEVFSQLFGLGRVSIFGVIHNGELLGNFTMVLAAESELPDQGLIELYASFVRTALLRYRSEQSLLKREIQLELVTNNMSDIVGLINAQGIWEYITPSVQKITGITPDEIIGTTGLSFVHPDDSARIAAGLKDMDSVREESRSEFRVHCQGGDYRWLEALTKPYWNEQGAYVGLIVSGRDITRRKLEEEALRKSEDELNLSEVRYRALSDASFEAVLISEKRDGQWIILDANMAAAEIFGYPLDELPGRRTDALFSPESRDLTKRQADSGSTERYDAICLRKDGQRFPVVVRGKTVLLGDKLVRIGTVRDMTEWNQAEEALRQREQEFRALAENSPDIITRIDRNLRRLYINPAVEKETSTGHSRDSLLGKTILEVGMSRPNAEKFGAAVNEVFASGKEGELFYEYISPTRENYYFARLVPELAADGSVATVLSIIRNITSQKLAEKALRESESKYRFFMQNYHGIAFQGDLDFRTTFIDGAVEKITGYPAGAFIRGEVTWKGLIHPDDQAKALINPRELLPGQHRTGECRITRKDGAIRWISRIIQIVSAGPDQPIAVQGTVYDITERKTAELALQESESHYHTLVENVPGAIFRRSGTLDAPITYYNQEIEKICGYSVSDLSSGKISWLEDIVHPEDRERVRQARSQFYSRASRYDNEYRIIHADGSTRWVQSIGQSFWDGDTFLWLDGLFIDITERKEAEERVNYLTFRDSLTGLYNRNFFEEELKRLNVFRQLPTSFILGDLNGLKLINDSLGHLEGDKYLGQTAKALQNSCRQDDIVCRWGGDEFAILLPRTTEQTAETICARIREECQLLTADWPIPISLSLGTATRTDMGQTMPEVIKEAEDRMYRQKLLESHSARSYLITFLLKTLESRTKETPEHNLRLKDRATMLGKEISLSASGLDKLVLLSTMHDIGKIAVPDHILDKPGPLTPEERDAIQKHSEHGYRIAQSATDLALVAEEILSHHEWWDGSGYPRGLQGTAIPLLARIISIVDAYDVMTNGRPYRAPMPPAEAVAELRRWAGRQFDPGLVLVFAEKVFPLLDK